jgi:hypothetical protein
VPLERMPGPMGRVLKFAMLMFGFAERGREGKLSAVDVGGLRGFGFVLPVREAVVDVGGRVDVYVDDEVVEVEVCVEGCGFDVQLKRVPVVGRRDDVVGKDGNASLPLRVVLGPERVADWRVEGERILPQLPWRAVLLRDDC